MAGIKASFYKDMKLFRTSVGLLSLILPFLLAAVMSVTVSTVSPASFIRPFKVAVIDEDQTMMSQMIIAEARAVPVFSAVDERTEDPEELIEKGYTAVFTIPRDFFYDAYTFEQKPVRVLFNNENRLQSAVFRSVFTSIMDIMKTEQAVSKTVYDYDPDALTDKEKNGMYENSSKRLLSAALSRNNIFDSKETASDLAGALLRKTAAVSILFLLLFQAFSIAKTIPQETRLGVSQRMKALNGNRMSLLISKGLFYLYLTVPSLCLFGILIAFQTGVMPASLQISEYAALCLLMITASFIPALAAARFSVTASGIRRTGNILILLSLFFSGTLIPFRELPETISFIRYLLPAGYLYPALEAIALNVSFPVFLKMIWPVILITAVSGLTLLLPRFTRRAGRTIRDNRSPQKNKTGILIRFLSVSLIKFVQAAGRGTGLLLSCAVCLACAYAASGTKDNIPAVRITVTDLAETEETKHLLSELTETEGLEVIQTDEAEAFALLSSAETEGMLVINEKCGSYLRNETEKQKDLVTYTGASSSFSAEAVREVIAGKTASEKLRSETVQRISDLYGITPDDIDKEKVISALSENETQMNDLFDLQYTEGTPEKDPFRPPFESYPAMAALFLCMTAASWCGSRDNRHAGRRLLSLPGGILLRTGSDLLSVFSCGLIPLACFAIFHPYPVGAALLYLLNISALSLLIAEKSEAEGKIDAISPYTAFIICLTGGCFTDLSAAFTGLRILSMISPAGLFLQMCTGNPAAYMITAAETLLFIVFLLL